MKKIVLAFAVMACVSLVSCHGGCARPSKKASTPQGVESSAPQGYGDDSVYEIEPVDSVTGNDSVIGYDSVTGGY